MVFSRYRVLTYVYYKMTLWYLSFVFFCKIFRDFILILLGLLIYLFTDFRLDRLSVTNCGSIKDLPKIPHLVS